MSNDLPIGVFDSGVGGLTVLSALRHSLPHEHFVYLGDTARLPYGTKSQSSVEKYSLQASHALIQHGIKLLVVACNTASTLALHAMKAHYPNIPIIGVLEPSAHEACRVTRNNHIAVIATESTIKSAGYQSLIKTIMPSATVTAKSCSLFVALAEEGWVTGPVAELVTKEYLSPLLTSHFDTLVLGCTHFPTMQSTIANFLGEQITIVDSASATARLVRQTLQDHNLLNHATNHSPTCQFYVTDSPERFLRVAKNFLNHPIMADQVLLVDSQSLSDITKQ